MKKLFLLLIVVCCCGHAIHAQDKSDVGKIPLDIIMPESQDADMQNCLDHLHIKVAQIVTATGMSSDGFTPSFAIFPTLAVTESKVVEGGMENINVVTVELTLFIKEIDNDVLIASTVRKLKGSGSSYHSAMVNAVSGISPDNEYKKFIQDSKQKIIDYYNSSCGNLLVTADNMAKKQDYEAALAVLMSIPIEAKGCYTSAQQKSVEIYKLYQKKECATLVQTAKAQIAATQWADALNTLSEIDPLSPCAKEASDLIATTGKKVDAQQKKEWDALMKIYSDEVALEHHRIDAITAIAVSYSAKERSSSRKKSYRRD